MSRQRFLGTCFNDVLIVETLRALRVTSGLPDTQNKSPAGKGDSSLSKAVQDTHARHGDNERKIWGMLEVLRRGAP